MGAGCRHLGGSTACSAQATTTPPPWCRPPDPEFTILKQRLARRLRYEGITDESASGLTLVDITKVGGGGGWGHHRRGVGWGWGVEVWVW